MSERAAIADASASRRGIAPWGAFDGSELLPEDFRFGVATAAYQIEGAAQEGGRGPSIWDTFAKTPGLTRNGDTGDVACDHYHLWQQDLDLMAGLHIGHYRLSVSWSRLQPSGHGNLNPEGVAFYRRLLEGARDRGITPVVTLYHWDLPQPLEDAGGWPVRATAEAFADYAARTVTALGDLVDEWITLNEPWCSSMLGYDIGAHAPGRRSRADGLAAAHHLLLAHGLATARMRAARPGIGIGIANLITEIVPAADAPEDAAAAARLDAMSNALFLDPLYAGRYPEYVLDQFAQHGLSDLVREGDLETISAPTDFVGLNHYQRIVASHQPGARDDVGESPADPASTSFGWSVTPDALVAVLERVHAAAGLPIYVTESGASFNDYVDPNGTVVDSDRVAYLQGYFAAAASAISRGVDLRGYYVWSFLDNYEWAEGYSKRFGIVYVDYATQARIPKLSADWLRAQIDHHAARAQVDE